MKSMLDIVNAIGGGIHTRNIDLCMGVQYHSTYQTEILDEYCSTVLEVSGKGRILAIVPFTTNSSYYGTIKAYVDGKELVKGACYYNSSYMYPFLESEEFRKMLNMGRHGINSTYSNSGIYIPELSRTLMSGSEIYTIPYRHNYKDFIKEPGVNKYPIYLDSSSGSTDGVFEHSLKIIASQTGGSGYVDNYTYIMVIYDLSN